MTSVLIWVIVVGVAVLLVVLAIRDREKGTQERGQASALLRAGLMEAQNLLEPDRKIEVVREIERSEDLVMADDRSGGPPDGPAPRAKRCRGPEQDRRELDVIATASKPASRN